MPRIVSRPYRRLAQHYDQLFSGSRAPADMARLRLLGRILPSVTSACDLACGTGTTALELAGKGIKTFAVDLSPEMCRLAREKVSRARLPVRVLCADMRAFRLPQPVDLITCEFDALNHVPRKADLSRVAKCVARALHPGGYFFFDVNNRAGFERYWSGAYKMERAGLVVIMQSGHDSRRDAAWSDIEISVRKGRLWERMQERVHEVCWSAGEIRGSLREAGFDRIRAWDATPFFKGNPIIRPACRTFYVARKGMKGSG